MRDYIQQVNEGRIIETAEMNLVIILKAKLTQDGNQWCWLFGDNIQDGVAGFGASPYLAALDFNKAFHQQLPQSPEQPTTPESEEPTPSKFTTKLRLISADIAHRTNRRRFRLAAAAIDELEKAMLLLTDEADRLSKNANVLNLIGMTSTMMLRHRIDDARKALANLGALSDE